MFKQIGRGALLLVAGGFLLGGASLAEAGQWLVIDVDGEGMKLKPGTLLVEKQQVTLAEGQRLTLLADDGQTLKLTGPYSGAPGEKSAAGGGGKNLVVIASLLQGHSQPASAVGALRGSTHKTAPPGTVDVDKVNSSSKRCLATDPVMLWRSNATSQESVVLTDAGGKMLVSLNWPMGEAKLAVSAEHFADGQTYLIQRRNATDVKLDVRKAAQLMDNPAALAAWMVESGCKEQALSVLQDLKY